MMCYINRFWKGAFRHLYQQLLHLIAFFLVGLGQLYAENWKRDNLVGERVEHIGGFSADTLETKYGFVRFEQGNGRYGFDLGAEAWYQKTTILDAFYKPFGKGYIAPWKLIPVGEQDEVIAKYEGRSISNLTKVRFASAPNSTSIPAEFDERTKTWKLSLPATDANSSYDVFALYEGKVIGKLRVVSYPKQSYRVRLVPVNGQSVGDVSALSQNLNDIYNQYGVSFTLYEGEGMTAQFSPSNLKSELRELNKQYQQAHTLTSEEVCIFVLSEELGKGSKYEEVEGLMPRGSRFGYIFAGNSPNEEGLARTLAHELGHGLFTLRHTSAATYGRSSRRPTANLMDDQPQGVELAAYQWNIMASPAPFTGFDRDKDAQKVKFEASVNGNNWGIAPDGRAIRSFSSNPGTEVVHGLRVDSFYINSISVYRDGTLLKQFKWDVSKRTYVSPSNEKIEDAIEVTLTYNTSKEKVKTRLYNYLEGDQCFYYYVDVLYQPGDLNSLAISADLDWSKGRLWRSSESCQSLDIIQQTLVRDKQPDDRQLIKDDLLRLRGLTLDGTISVKSLVDELNRSYLPSLKLLNYEEIIGFFSKIAQSPTLKEQEELAILRLMRALNGKDYPRFYQVLEANQNSLLRHLVSEMDDVSVYFWIDGDNYTNFIGALVWMFNADKGQSIAARWPNDDTIATSILNLEPITYGAIESSVFSTSWKTKHNSGSYDASTGEVTLYDVYTTRQINTLGERPIISIEDKEEIGVVSPLTPIVIVPSGEQLPLVETALGGNVLSNQMYVVPAIFLKYRGDKIRNDYIEKGVVTTLDIATIALSGGTALATKVHWVRRAWALAEVAGAVGNIAINTQAVSNPEFRQLVDSYNLAMGLIGVKQIGQAGYKFVKNLPDETKSLLQKSGELRQMLSQRYKAWKAQRARLGSDLSVPEQQILAQQERGWSALGLSDKVDSDIILGNKLDFIFGLATGNAHNIRRSKDMQSLLSQIGLYDNMATRDLIKKHLQDVYNSTDGVPDTHGNRMRESFLKGPRSGVVIQSHWKGNTLITIILKK